MDQKSEKHEAQDDRGDAEDFRAGDPVGTRVGASRPSHKDTTPAAPAKE